MTQLCNMHLLSGFPFYTLFFATSFAHKPVSILFSSALFFKVHCFKLDIVNISCKKGSLAKYELRTLERGVVMETEQRRPVVVMRLGLF